MGGLTDWHSRRRLPNALGAIALTAAAALPVAPGPALAQPRPPANAAADAGTDAAQKLLLQAAGRFSRGLFRPAAADYQQFLQQFPKHPEATSARYALAVCHYRLNEFDAAAGLFDQVLADPKFAQREEALAVLGHASLSAQRYDQAVAAFDRLLADFGTGKHAEAAALSRSQALYLAAKPAEALRAADAFARQYPRSADRPTALYFKGLSQKALNENDAAAATLAGLLKDHPDTRFKPDALLVLGQAFEAQGKLDEAAARFGEMLAAAPAARRPDAHYSLGAVLYRLGRYADAEREFAAVLATRGGDGPYAKPARLQLGLSQVAGGRTAEARTTLAGVAKDDPANAPAARYGLVQCDVAERKFDAALVTLDDLAKLQPPPVNAGQIAFDRGVCLAELNRHAEAADAFGRSAAADPSGPRAGEATYRQAFSLHKLGQVDASLTLCTKLGSAGPAVPAELVAAVQELSAENLFLLGRHKEAAAAYATLARTAGRDEARADRYAFRLGQCHYALGDYPATVSALKPLAAKPSVAGHEALGRAVFLLGDALLQQGKFAESAEALQKYLASARSPGTADEQEAQYKLAIAQLRGAAAAGAAVPPAAEQLLAKVAAVSGDSPWAARAEFELGQLAYQAKPPQLDRAAGHLKSVTAFDGGKPPADVAAPALYLLGWVDYEQKRFAEAAAQWADVAERYPTAALAPDAAFHRGVALRDAGEQEKALAALTAYADRHPTGRYAARARQLAAACLTALKREPEAKRILASLAADQSAVNDAVLYDLAWAQKGTTEAAAAADTYRRLLKEYPTSRLAPAARTELAEHLFGQKQYQEAADLLEPVAAAEGTDPKIRSAATYLLGSSYDKLNRADRAADVFAAYAKEFSGTEQAGTALYQAGVARASLGRHEEAERAFAEVLAKYPRHPQAAAALLKLGEAQADAGRHDAALASHRRFLTEHPKDPLAARAQFGVGWALENQKQYDAARDAYQKVTAATSGETAARAQYRTGETYAAEGKFEQAALALLVVEDVYAYPRWSAPALYAAGRAFERLGQKDLARQQYETVVTKYKEQAEPAKLAKARLEELSHR